MNVLRCIKPLTPSWALALSVAVVGMAKAQDAAQTYVPPWLFSGSLYVATVDELSQHHRALLEQEFDASAGDLICIGSADPSPATELDAFLREQPWQSVTSHRAVNLLESNLQQELEKIFEQLDGDCCVWLNAQALAESDAKTRRWLGAQLRSCLKREVTVCLDRCEQSDDPPSSSGDDAKPTCQPLAAELDLLPQMQLLCGESDASLPAAGDRLSIVIPDGAWVRVHGRELFNLSQLSSLTFAYPDSGSKRDDASLRLPPRAVCDLVAMRRALDERARPPFPADKAYDPRLENGSLVIVGGGGMSPEIWEKFIELAGGADAKIIVLPTAVPEPEEDPYEARVLHRLGVRDVRVLPQTERDEVSDPEYLKHFQSATGIWFGGGRQWRFVDAYWGTPAWQAMIDVVRRGGVIGGSSAGATIQGDLLVRGHPLGNHIMIADGYRHGLGLLPGVAIDQHFRQRNRFDDLAGVVERFPTILGVGIDEDTALVVEAPSRCSVLGKGSVWLSRPTQGNEKRNYTEHRSGSQFDLRVSAVKE